MSEINVDVRAVHGTTHISQECEFTQEGDAMCEPEDSQTALSFATRHISRKELFYRKCQQQVPLLLEENRELQFREPVFQGQPPGTEALISRYFTVNKSSSMHPEEIQVSSQSEGFQIDKQVNSPEAESADEPIDVENCSVNGSSNGQINGNGGPTVTQHDEKALSLSGQEDGDTYSDSNVTDGEEVPTRKPLTSCLKRNRQNSNSSHSSSVSSSRSAKHQTSSAALQMDVSSHDDLVDNMEPLLIQGSAEDLEVSTTDVASGAGEKIEKSSKSNIDNPDQKAAESVSPDDLPTHELGPDPESGKSQLKVKSPKTKKPKQVIPVDASDELPIQFDETEKRSVKVSKSPSRRSKLSITKQDLKKVEEKGDEKSEADSGLRRSSRPRQTPQKYNASPFFEYGIEGPFVDERLNSSEALFGSNIRSVRGRKSLRKSRNMSSLNNSLHNESSPWENDFKVLSPSHEAFINLSVGDKSIDISAPLKRKADEVDEGQEEVVQEAKKMCVEESSDTSSQSFFSVVTSPFILLKNKFQRRSVSCSTPVKIEEKEIPVTDDDVTADTVSADSADVEVAPEAGSQTRGWCSIM